MPSCAWMAFNATHFFAHPRNGIQEAPGVFRSCCPRHLVFMVRRRRLVRPCDDSSCASRSRRLAWTWISTFCRSPLVFFFVFRGGGAAAGAPSARIYDVLGCGGPDILLRVRQWVVRRLGGWRPKDSPACTLEWKCPGGNTLRTVDAGGLREFAQTDSDNSRIAGVAPTSVVDGRGSDTSM